MPDAEPDPRLDALLDEVLAAPEAEQATTLQRSCEANPDAAPLLRRRFDCLVRFGLCSTGAAAPLTGTVLGDYRLGEALGGGGMGSVYRAERLRDGLVCALKVMHAELQRLPAARERLLREGRIASELRHRNLGEVLEVGHAGGVPFLAMRLVRGESLAQQLQREPAQLSGGADEVGWTVAASCTATSSRPTCCSTTVASRCWWTSGWRARSRRRR
jgi:hypothetical protein